MNKRKLNQILKNHEDWLENRGGERANLFGADLFRVNLSGADLSKADLSKANLSGADLSGATLSGANLSGATLSGANLSGADLSGANLSRANLSGVDLSRVDLSKADLSRANLSRANLFGADLSGANLFEVNFFGVILSEYQRSLFRITPEQGSFIGYKKVTNNVVLILEINKTAKRVNALSSRKCRASKVKVIGALNESKKKVSNGVWRSPIQTGKDAITYKLGRTYSVKNFCDDITKVCAPGIHFFLTYEEAKAYV